MTWEVINNERRFAARPLRVLLAPFRGARRSDVPSKDTPYQRTPVHACSLVLDDMAEQSDDRSDQHGPEPLEREK